MAKERILLCLCKMGGKEQDFIKEAFADNWVVPLGPNVEGFEKDLEKFLGQDKPVAAVSSGTAALHLGLVALGVEKGDEVIVQSLTFSASANPVVYQGATPIFVDSEPSTWDIDPELLDKAISDRKKKTGKSPKAIVPVHLYGMPAKMDSLMDVAKKWGIPVLEDAAEAFGSKYDDQMCGTFGEFGVLSFNGNKMITTSGGGALICPDEKAKKEVVKYATQSRENYPWYEHEQIGFNYRLSNISAGIGRGQMFVAKEYIDHHKWVQNCYREELSSIPGIRLHDNPGPKFNSNFWLSTIILKKGVKVKGDDGCGAPEAMRRQMELENIETRHIWKPMHLQPFFKKYPNYVNGVSQEIFETGLCLPAGPWVGEKEISRVISALKQNLE